jgi:hypothetical protein
VGWWLKRRKPQDTATTTTTEVIHDDKTRAADVPLDTMPGWDGRWKTLQEWWKDSDQYLPPYVGVNYSFTKDPRRYRRFRKYIMRKVAAKCLRRGEGLWIPEPGGDVLFDIDLLDAELVHAAVVWWMEEYAAHMRACADAINSPGSSGRDSCT